MKHAKQQHRVAARARPTPDQDRTILPQSLLLARPTLRYLDIYYQDILDHLRQQTLSEWAKASVQAQLASNARCQIGGVGDAQPEALSGGARAGEISASYSGKLTQGWTDFELKDGILI